MCTLKLFPDNETPTVGPVFGPLEPPVESFTIEVEEMSAFFDVENLDQTLPLLCLRSTLDVKAVNWSKHVSYALVTYLNYIIPLF